MALGNSVEDALDAVVELEIIGFQFSVDGDNLHYQGMRVEDQNGKQIPIDPMYICNRLALIKEHKAEVVAWLRTRTKTEIIRSLERISVRVQELAKVWEKWAEAYQKQTEYIWEHYTKVYRSFLLLEAEVNAEPDGVLQEVNIPGE
jgi:hypothetical protein